MLTLSFEAFRHLFGFSPHRPGPDNKAASGTGPGEPRDDKRATDELPAEKQTRDNAAGPGGGAATRDGAWTEPAKLLSAYLGARAEETMALLIEGLAREMAREMRESQDGISQTIADELAEVREGAALSQRELPRIGREMVRSGAALESLREGVTSIVPTVERLEASLREHIAREQAGAKEELAGPEEILATLDGLEIGLREGREMVGALSTVQNRLKDATTQRWWRAMGEATGVKRPLPEIPLADVESLVTGLELTYRRLQDALARRGVTGIQAVGKPFDPHVHEAVAIEPCSDEQDGLVLREQRRGYRTTDRVVRLSQVVVGRAGNNKTSARRSPEPNDGAKTSGRSRTRPGHAEQAPVTESQNTDLGPEESETIEAEK